MIQNKRKRIMLISSEQVSRVVIMDKLAEYFPLVKRKKNDYEYEEIVINYYHKMKKLNLRIAETNGYDINTHNVNINELSSKYI